MGERRNAYKLLVGKPEGRRPLGRPRRRWLDNIRTVLVEVGLGDADAVMKFRIPYSAERYTSGCSTGGL
jgi:hypothetical protein